MISWRVKSSTYLRAGHHFYSWSLVRTSLEIIKLKASTFFVLPIQPMWEGLCFSLTQRSRHRKMKRSTRDSRQKTWLKLLGLRDSILVFFKQWISVYHFIFTYDFHMIFILIKWLFILALSCGFYILLLRNWNCLCVTFVKTFLFPHSLTFFSTHNILSSVVWSLAQGFLIGEQEDIYLNWSVYFLFKLILILLQAQIRCKGSFLNVNWAKNF